MPRPSMLATAVAIVAVLALGAAEMAPAAGPETGTIVRVVLEPEASNGLEARLETSADEEVTLELRREGQGVTYEVQGEVTEAGLKARFGSLGTIDVTFAATRTLSSTEPANGCTGAPRTLREGVFSGTIVFRGERGYTQLEGPEAAGTMSVISQWRCPGSEVTLPYARSARLAALSSRDSGEERETASLHAIDRRCLCVFAAGVHHRRSGGGSIFYGYREERREGMEIVRVTSVTGPAPAFDYDHEAGTATLKAPRPLSGHATYKRRPHGRDLWRSTIRVPLLGAAPLATGGRGFRAGLYPEYHFD